MLNDLLKDKYAHTHLYSNGEINELLEFVKQQLEDSIPFDKPFLKMRYGKYVVYDYEWLKSHIGMEYDLITKAWDIEQADAIPIEWIKEYASNKSANDNMDCYWSFWEEDILEMIERWKKVNK